VLLPEALVVELARLVPATSVVLEVRIVPVDVLGDADVVLAVVVPAPAWVPPPLPPLQPHANWATTAAISSP
jgi:hypothetical protein